MQHGSAYGLDWMVITDHGSVAHAKIGVDKVNPDIVKARSLFDDQTLVFQGFEWNIPAAEHGTVFVHPGSNEVAVLKEFENAFDGVVNNWTASTAANEAHALEGLDFLAASVKSRRVQDAAVPRQPPGAQGARLAARDPRLARPPAHRRPRHGGGARPPGRRHQGADRARLRPGVLRQQPVARLVPGYPIESYITYGGFDWMTSTVGGLWDSLLAEGKPWWVTANSDSHQIYLDDSVRGGAGSAAEFNANGRYVDPVHGSTGPNPTYGDFWPGYYSRPTSAPRPSRMRRCWTACGPAGSTSRTAGWWAVVDVSVRSKGNRDPARRSDRS